MRNILFVLPLIGIFLFNSAHASLEEGLIVHYSFDGNANDRSGNNNHGTVNGAQLTIDRFGNENSAYSFNGINNFISASSDILPTAERTTTLWFKTNTVSKSPVLFSYGGGNCGSSWFIGFTVESNNNNYYLSSHCDINTLISPDSLDSIDTWLHLVISTDTSGTKIYINGVKIASNNNFITNTDVTGKNLSIGVATSPSGFAPYTDINVGYFDGSIDDVRVYDRALSESEIQELYQGDTETSCSPGTVSPDLDIHMPSLNYETLFGTQNIWADLEYLGTNDEGKHIWGLKDFGTNK